MDEFDMEQIEKYFEEQIKIVNEKNWFDLTVSDLHYLRDAEKGRKYRKMFRCIIDPLLAHMKSMKTFEFSRNSDELTCKEIVREIYDYYYKRGFDNKEIFEIAKDNNFKKKY